MVSGGSPEVHRLAEIIAVAGDSAPLWLVAEVAELTPAEAAEAADTLVVRGLLSGADPVRRDPSVSWDGLAGDAGSARRHGIDRRIAQCWARTAGGVEAAAAHLLAAPPGGEAWAAPFLRDAARAATEEGRHDDAVTRLERAVDEPAEADLRTELLAELGDARERAGRPGAEEAYRQALSVAVDGWRPRIHLRLGRTLYGAGDYRRAALELERGLDGLESRDEPQAVELVAAYVAAARFDKTLSEAAARHLAPILERPGPARTPAERALLAEVALEKGIQGGQRAEVVALAMRAWADGLLLEGADPYGIALSQVAAALTWSDALAESEMVLTVAAQRAERDGEAQLLATTLYLRSWPRFYAGNLDDAEADVLTALSTEGWGMYLPSARAVLAHVLIERGAFDEAKDVLVLEDPEPWRQTVPYAMLLEARARLHMAAGELEAAATDLTDAGELMAAMGAQHPFCPWRSRLGLVRAQLGDPVAGRELVELDLSQARAADVPRPTGIALHMRGLVARLEGGDGIQDLTQAAQLLGEVGARVDQARALVEIGASLLADGHRDEARPHLHAGADLARRIGADDTVERADYHLRRAGGRPRSADDTRPGGLTASELRVARLAARGLTNAQIAAELVVTPHTVRFHLGHAYRKLEVSGREALGAALGDHSA